MTLRNLSIKIFFKELTEAVNILKRKTEKDKQPCTSDNDLVFGGDIQKWIRFGNSLRLRYALRISYIDPARAKIRR